MQPHDVGRPLEGAEHDGDATVLSQVGGGLGAAAREVEIGDRVLVEHGEGAVEALGGEVDVPVGGEWRGRDEEEVLRLDERAQPSVDRVVQLHLASSVPASTPPAYEAVAMPTPG